MRNRSTHSLRRGRRAPRLFLGVAAQSPWPLCLWPLCLWALPAGCGGGATSSGTRDVSGSERAAQARALGAAAEAHFRGGDFAAALDEYTRLGDLLAQARRPARERTTNAYNVARALEGLGRDDAVEHYAALDLAHLGKAVRRDVERRLVALRAERVEADPGATVAAGEGPSSATPAGTSLGAPPVALTAYLVCERREGVGFAPVVDCQGAQLSAGDHVRVGFEVTAPAHVYVLNHNDLGQVQMMFPAPGQENRVLGGQRYFLPADDWLELDAQGGTTEQLRIVAAAQPVPALEALRRFAGEPGWSPEVAARADAFAERVAQRGFTRPGTPVRLAAEHGVGTPTLTLPMLQSGPDVAAVELRVEHH